MTREEALEKAEEYLTSRVHIEYYDDLPEVKEIIKALKQEPFTPTQEPMQVELEGDGYADGCLVYDYGKCPECGWQYEEGDKDWEEPFCCHCGQRLKWFE